MVSKHIIRRAQDNDLNNLVRLLQILFSLETDFTVDEAKQRSGLEMMLDEHNSRCVMVAELDQKIIGMCTAQILVSTSEGGIAALIEDVVVDPDYRGQSIGRELLLSIENWALRRGAKRLQLLADQHNIPALAFYKSMNWKRTQLVCLHKK